MNNILNENGIIGYGTVMYLSDIDKVDISKINELKYGPKHPFVLKKKYGVIVHKSQVVQSEKRGVLKADFQDRFKRHGIEVDIKEWIWDTDSLGDCTLVRFEFIMRVIKAEFNLYITYDHVYHMPFFHLLDVLYNKIDLDDNDPNRYAL